jgi:hypothetical protein
MFIDRGVFAYVALLHVQHRCGRPCTVYSYAGGPDWQCGQDGEDDEAEERDDNKKKKK